MKKFLVGLLASIALLSYNSGVLASETKKVCIDKITKDGKPVLDKKTGKPEQECKEMKVHKKLEGTKVPEKGDKK